MKSIGENATSGAVPLRMHVKARGTCEGSKELHEVRATVPYKTDGELKKQLDQGELNLAAWVTLSDLCQGRGKIEKNAEVLTIAVEGTKTVQVQGSGRVEMRMEFFETLSPHTVDIPYLSGAGAVEASLALAEKVAEKEGVRNFRAPEANVVEAREKLERKESQVAESRAKARSAGALSSHPYGFGSGRYW